MDAAVKWNFAPGYSLWFGQTKLPGNRERVISSQRLRFVDLSLLNTRYNLDRDIGVQLYHESEIGKSLFRQMASISMGEGRNITSGNQGGYDYKRKKNNQYTLGLSKYLAGHTVKVQSDIRY